MADLITLTAQPIRVTTPPSTGTSQPLWVVRDVLDYDTISLEFGLIGFETAGGGSLSLQIQTSLQREADEGWLAIGNVVTLSTVNTFATQTYSTSAVPAANILRYIRWFVLGGGSWGAQSAATFWIRGTAGTHQDFAKGVA